jgi:formylglycine-generating enzyme required for sulfatase activity
MCLIPGGSYEMGSGRSDSEKPVHSVTIRPFLIGRREFRESYWRAAGGPARTNGKAGNAMPITGVSWTACTDLAERLGLRLPSEAEWEYAARAGTSTAYYWGSDFRHSAIRHYGNSEGYGGNREAEPVEYRDDHYNAFALTNILGNVKEWCADVFKPNYDGAPSDGRAILTGGTERVARGGSFRMGAPLCTVTARLGLRQDLTVDDTGVRFAASIPGLP